ncbi:MAG: class I SAM-dependent methyltransferase [Thermoplasmatales archaeon]|nr:MAG: class I SAM-dependent methyltransferase [Thermoplasmatales archaeon]
MSKNIKQISRVTRSKSDAKAIYNKMSRWYDVLAGQFEKKFRDAGLQKLNVRDHEKVLELGFGTGHCILALAQSVGNSAKVYGIDISEGMLDITRAKVEKVGIAGRIKLICSDAVKLPFEADFFDAIFMSFTLELFDTAEIPIVLHECQRVLRNDGRICVVSLSKNRRATLIMNLYEWAHKKLPKYIDCRPIFVQKALEDAGFQIQEVTDMSMWGLPIEIVLANKGSNT